MISDLLTVDPKKLSRTDELTLFQHFAQQCREKTFRDNSHYLPMLLRWAGKPLTLRRYFAFREIFSTIVPDKMIVIAGRQLGKSQNAIACHQILRCATQPNRAIVCVAPLSEQVKRISSKYTGPFIDTSPFRNELVGSGAMNVFNRMFRNGSQIQYTYAFTSVDRARGLFGNDLYVDEVQDMDPSFIPVLQACLDGQDSQSETYCGTAKTTDNTLVKMHSTSSRAEWVIPCQHCTSGYGGQTWNIPSREHHLDAMVGPMRDDISMENPGVICYQCRKPLHPHLGHWEHRSPDLRWKQAGYHLPHVIFPTHYANPKKWAKLLGKRDGGGEWTPAKYYNEVMGEAYDQSAKLVSEPELRKAAQLGRNDLHAARKMREQAEATGSTWALSVDWGGGGVEEDSYTVFSLVGIHRDGRIVVPWAYRSPVPKDPILEAQMLIHFYNQFRPHVVAQDYNGAGETRIKIATSLGLPEAKLFNCIYQGAAKQKMTKYVPPDDRNPDPTYMVDKTQSLQLVCACIKLGAMEFFDWDYESEESRGLISDFLALSEQKTETFLGDRYRITKVAGQPDDFAQSVNMGTAALWYLTKSEPKHGDLLRKAKMRNLSQPILKIGPDGLPE